MVASGDAAPGLIFLILYLGFFALLTTLYAQKKISWKSRYSFVYFHVIMRLGGQISGVIFSFLSWNQFNTRLNTLVAYLVLSAEGYFSLVLCSYRFLIVWQQDRFETSNLEPRIPKGTPWRQRWKMVQRSPMAAIEYMLIGANAIIISGGSLLSNAMQDPANKQHSISTGKALRVAGTAIFLALVQVFALVAIQSYRRKGDRTLLCIIAVWPFLTVRGAFGIIQVLVSTFSYYNPEIYTDDGIKPSFLAAEYILATLMEWISCGLLISTYFSRVVGGEVLLEDWQNEAKREKEQNDLEEGGAGGLAEDERTQVGSPRGGDELALKKSPTQV
ncbi:hypothetical protein MNV49_002215 [Pseudohyphozyma bogoriensis]|nr:hypothetical protein MNV49_002215 [Pseudohyphozyma bogoriensis]